MFRHTIFKLLGLRNENIWRCLPVLSFCHKALKVNFTPVMIFFFSIMVKIIKCNLNAKQLLLIFHLESLPVITRSKNWSTWSVFTPGLKFRTLLCCNCWVMWCDFQCLPRTALRFVQATMTETPVAISECQRVFTFRVIFLMLIKAVFL